MKIASKTPKLIAYKGISVLHLMQLHNMAMNVIILE